MPQYNFKERFVPQVESGEKLHTIRDRRKRPTRVGERLYLYAGLRRPGARKLRPDNPKCTVVLPIEIHWDHVVLDGRRLSRGEMEKFAVADGFSNVKDFFQFWRQVHGLEPERPLKSFELIGWEEKPNT